MKKDNIVRIDRKDFIKIMSLYFDKEVIKHYVKPLLDQVTLPEDKEEPKKINHTFAEHSAYFTEPQDNPEPCDHSWNIHSSSKGIWQECRKCKIEKPEEHTHSFGCFQCGVPLEPQSYYDREVESQEIMKESLDNPEEKECKHYFLCVECATRPEEKPKPEVPERLFPAFGLVIKGTPVHDALLELTEAHNKIISYLEELAKDR